MTPLLTHSHLLCRSSSKIVFPGERVSSAALREQRLLMKNTVTSLAAGEFGGVAFLCSQAVLNS